MGTQELGMLGAVFGMGWSDVAVGAALGAAVAAFAGAVALTVGRNRSAGDRDDELELPIAG